jgi:hypothetical protein
VVARRILPTSGNEPSILLTDTTRNDLDVLGADWMIILKLIAMGAERIILVQDRGK